MDDRHGGGERAHAVACPSACRTTSTRTPRWPSSRTSCNAGANDLLLAVGYNHHETFGSHTTWNVEYGHNFNAALARDAGGRHGLSRARQHRPVRVRRQYGAAARDLAPGPARPAVAARRASQYLRLSAFRKRHRRSDRLRADRPGQPSPTRHRMSIARASAAPSSNTNGTARPGRCTATTSRRIRRT